jgi:poly(3-hydroxybutyrate) depolymerase
LITLFCSCSPEDPAHEAAGKGGAAGTHVADSGEPPGTVDATGTADVIRDLAGDDARDVTVSTDGALDSGPSGTTDAKGNIDATSDTGPSGTPDASPPAVDAASDAPKGRSAGCGKPPATGDTPGRFVKRNITVTGVDPAVKPATAGGSWTNRVYYLDLPTGYDPSVSYPLLFGGAGCGGALTTNGDNGGFPVLPANNQQAIQIGLSYVWPEGGGACFYDNGANTPDLPYFDSVLAEVEANYCVDRGKIFVGGFSSGGWLAYMLGLARGGIVRGISPAAGGLRPEGSRPPASKQPFAALLLTGADDTTNPATGPTGSDAARDLILSINGCQGTDTVDWPTCTNCGCVKYTGCPAAYPVIRCRPAGQGHSDGGGAFKSAIWSVWSTLP